ncbi:MAG: AMP-binding protein [Anaerovoracaceae bacterium]
MEKYSRAEIEHAEAVVKVIENDQRGFIKYRDSRPIINIKHMIETSCEKYSENVAFHRKPYKGAPYEQIKYKQLLEDMNGLGTGLIDLGLKDKRIAIIGENSYEWAIGYLSIVCGTGVVVPIDKELSKNEIRHIIEEAKVEAVIFSKKYEQLFKELKAEEGSKLRVLINKQLEEDSEDVYSFKKQLEKGKALVTSGDKRFVDSPINRDEMGILLFTSGTTGAAKGVMLSHGNIAEDLMVSPTVLKVNPWDIFFSVLPLHHTYECTCGFLMPIYKGASVAYCEGLKYITKNLGEIKPTMFLGVPAIFEKMYKKIWQNVRKQGKENLLKKVIKINNKTKKIGIDIGKIFFKDILAVFGGNMRLMICGGAAINPEVLEGIQDFGIQALQGYGLTECGPLGALNPDTAPVATSIGVEFPGIKVEIRDKNEDGIGEICVNGGNVMLGYYNMPEETARVKKDGFFYTGDYGYMDEKGYIYITGRKKNVIITKNGKNVFPEELEFLINLSPIVSESMVFEDENKDGDDTLIVANVVIDKEGLEEFYGKDLPKERVEELVNNIIEDINKEQPFYKKIKRIIVREEELMKNTSNKIVRVREENKR